MKDLQHEQFVNELNKFLLSIAGKGTIVTTRQLKRWVRGLDYTHPVKQSYLVYLNVESATDDDFEKITHHMKYVPGFYQTRGYPRRVGTGTETRVIYVRQNKIKISAK